MIHTVYLHTEYNEIFGHTTLNEEYEPMELIAQAIRLNFWNATIEDFIVEHMHDNHYYLKEKR